MARNCPEKPLRKQAQDQLALPLFKREAEKDRFRLH
jgi:hypothetical protein